jgi:hypothetical protein
MARPLLQEIDKLILSIQDSPDLKKVARTSVAAQIDDKTETYPINVFSIGSEDPKSPVLFICGGVHGLERIGAQLAWSLLKSTLDRLTWDKALQHLFSNIRLVALPLLNPVGYMNSTRSNGNGVDLMRNSPVRATEGTPFLVGGHRISNRLPWYQGSPGKLEPEAEALISTFHETTREASCVVAVDFHSGFGMKDRLWFPFSYTSTPFDDLPEMHALTELFEDIHPYHIYQIEPQSQGYLLGGDLWDHLFLEFKKGRKNATFLPLTLEMGSWTWVRKNPLQIFSKEGAFNPIREHRLKRTYRRHHLLFDFLLKALHSHEAWTGLDRNIRAQHEKWALQRWY